MDPVDVVAVVGACAPERRRHAAEAARAAGRDLFPAARLSMAADPVEEALALAPWAGPRGAVVEYPLRAPVDEVIGSLLDPEGQCRLTDVVCLVDAAHLVADLDDDAPVRHVATAGGRRFWDETPRGLLVAEQVELASTVVLADWERLATADLSTVMALVSHLNPAARLRLDRPGLDAAAPGGDPAPGREYAARQTGVGWIALLNGTHSPAMRDPRVSSLRYEQVRPFHPGRLAALLDGPLEAGEFGTVLRSCGFCRLATRPGVTARWSHAGRAISLEPVARDVAPGLGDEDAEVLAVGQELGITGLDLDAAGLVAALDAAALTDAELLAGGAAWAALPDPFPAWAGVGDRAD
ncbi:GTP-binding protein [Rothia sp. AR01]|uniref:GTP-binding protein n=1 Tax=Rothia santali TaxID=2949643 RepID=A0A9X2H955_9MICC|nr:GTP-binding protein [Rothia santali]MCP3425384.1 GTP-binding protein [Rothia santali]